MDVFNALTKRRQRSGSRVRCHEGNLGLMNILSAARAEEKAADEAKKKAK
jgi:hypothetical protein